MSAAILMPTISNFKFVTRECEWRDFHPQPWRCFSFPLAKDKILPGETQLHTGGGEEKFAVFGGAAHSNREGQERASIEKTPAWGCVGIQALKYGV